MIKKTTFIPSEKEKKKKGPKTTVLILGIGTGQAAQPPIISREGAGTVSIKRRE